MTVPGWYPDPANPYVTRFWSGGAWTAMRTWDGSNWTAALMPPAQPVPPTASWDAGAPRDSATPVPSPPYPLATSFAPAPYAAALAGGPQWATGPATPVRNRISGKAANRTFLTLAGTGLVVIGCLLPWATQNNGFTTQTIGGTSAGGGDVDLVLALVIGSLAGLFLAGRTGFKTNMTALLLAALVVVVCIANMANISRLINQEKITTDALPGSSPGTSLGIGLVIVLVGGCLAVVGSILTIAAARRDARARP
jgi:hypothetical protein